MWDKNIVGSACDSNFGYPKYWTTSVNQAIVIRFICIYTSIKIKFYGTIVFIFVLYSIHQIKYDKLSALIEPWTMNSTIDNLMTQNFKNLLTRRKIYQNNCNQQKHMPSPTCCSMCIFIKVEKPSIHHHNKQTQHLSNRFSGSRKESPIFSKHVSHVFRRGNFVHWLHTVSVSVTEFLSLNRMTKFPKNKCGSYFLLMNGTQFLVGIYAPMFCNKILINWQ